MTLEQHKELLEHTIKKTSDNMKIYKLDAIEHAKLADVILRAQSMLLSLEEYDAKLIKIEKNK